MKKLPAIIATFVTTLVVGVIIFLIGMNALFNPNSVQASNSPTDPAASTSAATSSQDKNISANSSAAASAQAAQIQQLQSRINEYQTREKTLTSNLQQSQQQLQQAQQQLSQYQQVLQQLQQIGLIRIGQDGTIMLGRGGFRGGGDD